MGRLRKGLKLPGTREVAEILKINRMTVVSAYDELQAQGWIEMIPRKGTFIRKDLPVLKPRRIATIPEVFVIPDTTSYPLDENSIVPYPYHDFPETEKLIINDGFPDVRTAPIDELIRNMRSQSKRHSHQRYLLYGGSQGTMQLREALAQFLSDTRGLPVTPAHILVTRGAQMGLYLAASVLAKRGDHAIVGEPSYIGANITFRQLGISLHTVPVDSEGMDIDSIEQQCQKKKIKFVYIIPHHHHPTTVTLTPERRISLLELSLKYKFAIIEDDYDYDFHYTSRPMMPISSMDRHGSTIYIGTLTKTLAPSIRIGFIAGPVNFIHLATYLRKSIDTQGNSLLENAVAELFKDGTITRHIKKSVKLYKERRDHFCKLLDTELKGHVSFKVPDGGMAVWTKYLHTDPGDISNKAYEKGLIVNTGKIFNSRTTNYNSVRLGFASLNIQEQHQAVDTLNWCFNN